MTTNQIAVISSVSPVDQEFCEAYTRLARLFAYPTVILAKSLDDSTKMKFVESVNVLQKITYGNLTEDQITTLGYDDKVDDQEEEE